MPCVYYSWFDYAEACAQMGRYDPQPIYWHSPGWNCLSMDERQSVKAMP